MSFGEAIKSVFSKYATFKGRARRSEYWYFFLFQFLVSDLLFIFDKYLFEKDLFIPVTISGTTIAIGLQFLFYLAVLIPNLAVAVRRLHDTGTSGWLYMPLFIISLALNVYNVINDIVSLKTLDIESPLGIMVLVVALLFLAYSILILVWLFRDSDQDANRYGPNPKFPEPDYY